MSKTKKLILSLTLCVTCLFSVCACGQTENTTANTDSGSAAVTTTDTGSAGSAADTAVDSSDYLSEISGTYVELFPEMSKDEYRQLWLDAAAPLVGEENAESATDMLLSMCMAESYGADVMDQYAADPSSAKFDCYFIGGVKQFVMDGDKITGLDEQGNEVFSHNYKKIDVDNENDFIFYQSEDENSGQFTYFAFAPDTMETTYHLEFRYAEDLNDLQSWYEGNYAYWNAAAISADYTEDTMKDAIQLFASENLKEQN